jgi:hypothetical protein
MFVAFGPLTVATFVEDVEVHTQIMKTNLSIELMDSSSTPSTLEAERI